MKKFKNIFLVIIMIISLVGVLFTVWHAKNNILPSSNLENEIVEQHNNFSNDINDTDSFMKQPLNSNPNNLQQNIQLTTPYIIIIGFFTSIFSFSLVYLLMSINNKKFYKNNDKLIIYILINIILIGSFIIIITFITNNLVLNNQKNIINENQNKDNTVLDKSNVISNGNINLNNHNTDVTITEGGIYTFFGEFTHSIIVDAENEDVQIVLNNVEIINENTATIIGLSANKITITLADGSENILIDGGNSEYDGCIFSNTELIFDGFGNLTIEGNQNEGEGIATNAQNIIFNNGNYNITANDDGINAGGDGATIIINDGIFYIDASGDGIDSNKNAIINGGTIFVIGSDIGGDSGIDTDDGYEINGGLVVALGSDMIETPLDTSNQKTIAFSLSENILKDVIVTLMKGEDEIVSFQAPKSFKTIIISTSSLEDGAYTLYKNGSNSGILNNGIYYNSSYSRGEKIIIDSVDTFIISKTINLFENVYR